PTPVRWLVVAAEPVTSVDVTACDMVAELDEALHARSIELCLAELKDPVKDKLKRFGLYAQLGEGYFFPTIGVAVSRYLEINNVEWDDWEDQSETETSLTKPDSAIPAITAKTTSSPESEVGVNTGSDRPMLKTALLTQSGQHRQARWFRACR